MLTTFALGRHCSAARRPGRASLRAAVVGLALIVVLASTGAVAHAATFSWSSPVAIDPSGGQQSLSAIACPAANQCVAVDGNGSVVTFNPASPGTSSTVTTIAPRTSLSGLVCPSASECIAVGGGVDATFDPSAPTGATVNTLEPATGSQDLVAVACPSTSQCTAIDYASGDAVTFNPTATGGGSVAAAPVAGNYSLGSISCPSTAQCTTLDRYDGSQHTFNPATPGTINSVQIDATGNNTSTVVCLSASECVATDSGGNEVTFDPTATTTPTPRAIMPGGGLGALVCPSQTSCVATDGSIGVVSFDPAAPALATDHLVGVAGGLHGLACSSSSQCIAVDGAGNAITLDPTTAGNLRVSIASGTALQGVSCPSASQCTSVDGSGHELTFDPTSPGSPAARTIDGTNSITGVACPATSECVGVDSAGNEIKFDPTASPVTGAVTNIDGTNAIDGIACLSTSECVAVDNAGNEIKFDPTASPVTAAVTNVDPNSIGGIACASAGQCVGVDSSGSEVTFDPTAPGAATVTQVAPHTWYRFNAVACPSTTQCTAVDFLGDELTFNPTSPAVVNPAGIGGGYPGYSGITCPSTTQCTAVGPSGVTFNPAAPASQRTVSETGTALACPSAGQCTAVDGGGSETTFDPTGTPPQIRVAAVDTYQPLGGVSCPTATQCTAVDPGAAELTFDPLALSRPTPVLLDPAGFGGPSSIACQSATQCTALGSNGDAVTFNPSAPGSPTPHSGFPGGDFACPALNECVAMGGTDEYTFGPTSSTPPTGQPEDLFGYAFFGGVACPSTTQCTAIDEFGSVATFNPIVPSDETWTVLNFQADRDVPDIACPSTTQCTAVSYNGGIMTFDPTDPHAGTIRQVGTALTDIACPSTGECIAVDRKGEAVVGDPTQPRSFKVQAIPGEGGVPSSISCPSVTECVVVDNVGSAFVGMTAPVSTGVPTISGTATQGDTLTVAHGSWLGSPTSYSYQWQRCDAAGNSCTPITGATSRTYSLTSVDVGSTIRVQEKATSTAGTSDPATSSQTAIVVSSGGGGGGGSPPSSPPPPKITAVRALAHPRGATLEYTLNEAATVRIVITGRLPGRKHGTSCLAPTKRLRHAKACIRTINFGTLTRTSHQGANTVAFSGRIGTKALKPGHYKATLTASSAAGTSQSITVNFTIVAS